MSDPAHTKPTGGPAFKKPSGDTPPRDPHVKPTAEPTGKAKMPDTAIAHEAHEADYFKKTQDGKTGSHYHAKD